MPKLTELKGAENLPKKVEHSDYCFYGLNESTPCTCGAIAFNTAIDAYNNLDFGGDVESMNLIINKALADREDFKEKAFNSKTKPRIPTMAEFISKALLESMPTWVVVKKGGV